MPGRDKWRRREAAKLAVLDAAAAYVAAVEDMDPVAIRSAWQRLRDAVHVLREVTG